MRRTGILVLLLAAGAAADNDPAGQIRKLASEGKSLEAVRLAGAWVADAQKRGDLLDEENAWKTLRSKAGGGETNVLAVDVPASARERVRVRIAPADRALETGSVEVDVPIANERR